MRQAALRVFEEARCVGYGGCYRCCGTAIAFEFSLVGAGGFSEDEQEEKKKTDRERQRDRKKTIIVYLASQLRLVITTCNNI